MRGSMLILLAMDAIDVVMFSALARSSACDMSHGHSNDGSNDGSSDGWEPVVRRLQQDKPQCKQLTRRLKNGCAPKNCSGIGSSGV